MVAGYVAWRQWQTAKTKVQLDLYDKRLPVYQATRELLGRITTDGFPSDAGLWAFAMATEQAPFLFDDAFAARLQAIYDRLDQARLDEKLVHSADPEVREPAIRRGPEHMAWLDKEYRGLTAAFAPYLRLEGRKGWSQS